MNSYIFKNKTTMYTKKQLKEIFTKKNIEEAVGQRVMDYSIDEDGDINFSVRMEEYGFDTDRNWYADFILNTKGELIWSPNIPTECTIAGRKIEFLNDIDEELSCWGDWENPDEDDE